VALETALSRSRSRPEDVSAAEKEFIQRSASGRHVAFGPDGRTVVLVSASADTVSLWDVAEGVWLGRWLEEPGLAEIMDFSEQGLLIQDTEGRIRYGDLHSAASLRLNLPPAGPGGQWHTVEAWRLGEDGVSAVFGGGERLAVPLEPKRWMWTLCARAMPTGTSCRRKCAGGGLPA
jgi:hypothetical protein